MILLSNFTKSKRFEIINHKGYYGDYTEWKKKLNLSWNDKINNLKVSGYTEVPNNNGGDDDYLCIDHQNKEFIWCENGFYPFYIGNLEEFENNNPLITLSYLYSIRK